MNIENIVIEFHERYNLIFDKQDHLPKRKSLKDYSMLEDEIKDLARKLIIDLIEFKNHLQNTESKYLLQIDNIIAGCNSLISDPYKRFGGRIDIDF